MKNLHGGMGASQATALLAAVLNSKQVFVIDVKGLLLKGGVQK